MKWLLGLIGQEPVMFQGVIQTFIPVMVALGVVSLSGESVSAIFACTAAILTFVTRKQVTPVAKARDTSASGAH